MIDEMEKKLEVTAENAPKFRKWIAERGGVAVWNSVDLGDIGKSWSTPAKTEDGADMKKPSWQSCEQPSRIIKDESEIEVITRKDVKTILIGIERGSGLSFNLTRAASKRLRDACDKAGPESSYQFSFDDKERRIAIIMVPDKRVPLNEWKEVSK